MIKLQQLFFISVLIISVVASSSAQELTIGIPEPELRNQRAIADELFWTLTSIPLMRRNEDGVVLPVALGSMRERRADNVLELRVRQGISLSSGAGASGADLQYSVRRCLGSEYQDRVRPVVKDGAVLIELKTDEPAWRAELQKRLLNCPLLDSASAKILGEALDPAGMIVSSGSYVLDWRNSGRSWEFTRRDNTSRGPLKIRIKVIRDEATALSSLRSGELNDIVLSDSSVVTQAQKDETLSAQACRGGYWKVSRKELVVPCFDRFNPATLGEQRGIRG